VLIELAKTREKQSRAEFKKRDPKGYTHSRYLEHIKGKYGLTVGDYERMKLACGNLCESCGKEMSRPLVDHDHITNKVRGLLCNRCNVMVGYLEKNPRLLMSAVAWLAKHGGKLAA
jgi:hypothetical protein